MGVGWGCGSEPAPTMERQRGTQTVLENAGVGEMWVPVLLPLAVPSLLQFYHILAAGSGWGEMQGNKGEGKRRDGLPSFFAGKQRPCCPSCVVWAGHISSVNLSFCLTVLFQKLDEIRSVKMLGQG